MSAMLPLPVPARARRALPDACLVALRLSGWLAVTALATMGCFVLFFLALGGFTADGFFAHVHNLARRFVEADAGRRAQFVQLVAAATAVLAAVVGGCRWRSLGRSFHLGNA